MDNDRIKILQLKVLIAALGILLILLTWTLFMLAFGGESAERFRARETPEPTPTATPFVLTNFDKIRVVITDKATGSIYHSNIDSWHEYMAESTETTGQEKTATEGAASDTIVQGKQKYRGSLEFIETADGYVIINELPIEEYLYSVVPSEMPSSYPVEALKAQAICARTYAYLHILSPGYPQWNAHVDDTTAYQVYHSVAEQDSTNRAVNETEGMVLVAPEGLSLAETYYYSTSCGYGSDAHVWKTKYSDCYPYIKSKHINKLDEAQEALSTEEFETYIKTVNVADYEAEEAWYRWQYHVEEIDTQRMLKVLQQRYAVNDRLILTLKGDDFVSQPIKELEEVLDLVIERREAGGVADELLIITEENVYKVITEMNIRYVLNDGISLVERQDGTKVEMFSLLPSGFFVLENIYEKGRITGYEIIGGGYGHGAGMSQNAAKAMAMEGMSAEDILAFFFEDCTVKEK